MPASLKKILKRKSKGLTLVETMTALYILTAASATLVSAAVFGFSTYAQNHQKFTALYLAKEGTEIVRNIRDSNWLPTASPYYVADPSSGLDGLIDDCAAEISADQYCYKEWQSYQNTNLASFCQNGCQVITTIPGGGLSLQNRLTWPGGDQVFALYKQGNGVYTPNVSGTALYFRKTVVTPYDPADHETVLDPANGVNAELGVVTTVSWLGKGCDAPADNDPANAPENCKIIVENRLTNWKNY